MTEKYNNLTIVDKYKVTINGRSRTYAKAICNCGNEKVCDYYSIKSGLTKSCGCLKSKTSADTSIKKSLKKKNEVIGTLYNTNEGFVIKIVDYINRHNVEIEFQSEPFYKTVTTMQNIRNGEIKNPYYKTVYNIGYYGDGTYTSRINGKKTVEYTKWFSMFNRCYDEEYQKKQPRYIGCKVDRSFHCFQDFAQWFNLNVYEYSEPLELDKDLLVEGNKLYSKDTCCLIPKEINNSLIYKSSDICHMTKLYNKYKAILPEKIVKALYKYTIKEEIT